MVIIYLALSPSCLCPSPLSYISMMEAIAHEVCDPLGVSWEHAGMGSRDRTHLLESQAWPGAPIHHWLSCALNIKLLAS